jgi:hypothetical protein
LEVENDNGGQGDRLIEGRFQITRVQDNICKSSPHGEDREGLRGGGGGTGRQEQREGRREEKEGGK